MLKSVKNLRMLNPGLCFFLNPEGFIQILKYDEKNPPVGVLMTKTPRVRMLGTRLGDEKSNSYKDIRAEFSWHEFPRWAFYFDDTENKLQIGFEEYKLDCCCFSGLPVPANIDSVSSLIF